MSSLRRKLWDRLSIYLPIVLMGVFALGSWWLVRSTPGIEEGGPTRLVRHEPDYFMRGFAVKTFDPDGKLKSEVWGAEVHHFPDTETLEISQVRIRIVDAQGRRTVATALKGVSNQDGTDVLLQGDARVVRERTTTANGKAQPRLEFRGETLHIFSDAERVTSDQPVQLLHDDDQFTADTLSYDHHNRVLELQGRVRGVLQPRNGR